MLTGYHVFDLDQTGSGITSSIRTEIAVYFDVSVGWDKRDGSIVYGTPTPTTCNVLIGGTSVCDDLEFDELAPSAREWIQFKLRHLDMADLGIDNDSAMEELADMADASSGVE